MITGEGVWSNKDSNCNEDQDSDHTEASRPLTAASVPAALFAAIRPPPDSLPRVSRDDTATVHLQSQTQKASRKKIPGAHFPRRHLRARVPRTPSPRPHASARHPLSPLHLSQHHHPPPRRLPQRLPLRPARASARVSPSRHRPHPPC